MGGSAAKTGFNREKMFVQLINTIPQFRQQVEKSLSDLKIENGTIMNAKVLKGRYKTDVLLTVALNDGNTRVIGCSLKSAKANFNQLDRRWLSALAECLEMPQKIREEIQQSLDRKAVQSRAVFITKAQELSVSCFFEARKQKLLEELFTKNEASLEVFVTFDEIQNKWSISKIKDMIDYLMTLPVKRTTRGVLKFGSVLSLQRKGGDGNVKNIEKTSPKHPSNQLQFKIKPLTVIQNVPTCYVSARHLYNSEHSKIS